MKTNQSALKGSRLVVEGHSPLQKLEVMNKNNVTKSPCNENLITHGTCVVKQGHREIF